MKPIYEVDGSALYILTGDSGRMNERLFSHEESAKISDYR